MELSKIIIYIVLIIIILLIIKVYKLEKFNNIDGVVLDPNIKKKTTVSHIDITKQFPEVNIFENDTDFRMGLDKCYEHKKKNNNKGNCVEYGYTGNAWYFPEVEIDYGNFRKETIKSNQQKDFEIINADERNQDEPNQMKMTYRF